MEEAEEIVMTPSKRGKTTHICIEKKRKLNFEDDGVQHVAGGQHKGLVVNKAVLDEDEEALSRPQLQIGFNCFLVNEKTHSRLVESRRLKFWYTDGVEYLDQVTTAYEFFKELVRPENFPRDYVGFIKKCMKQMQKSEYRAARKVDLEIKQLDEEDAPLSPGLTKEDSRPQEEVVREKILQVLESAYPNALAVEDLIKITGADHSMVSLQLHELRQKNLIRDLDEKVVRHVLEDEKTVGDVEMVQQMPTIAANQQPTIAVITANYSEKLAVDAMMEKKKTFVKFKSEGESNVYTTGYIGEHNVVSTKLSAIGHYRAAQIASGNTTTRLLGTFQNIEHVFVVGVAGGVPHYTDFYKHVRLGDVIISTCNDDGYMYYYCDKIRHDPEGRLQYSNIKNWAPPDKELQSVVEKIQSRVSRVQNYQKYPWDKYIADGLELLKNQEADFNRPPPSSDRLYVSIGDDNVIEVQHPDRPDSEMEMNNCSPAIHYGVIGSGRVVRNEELRMDFAQRYGIKCYDSEFDQVLDSIVGNRKDSFMFIRGIADYVDGTKNKEWQPYASLAAAAMMKTIIKAISNPGLSEDED